MPDDGDAVVARSYGGKSAEETGNTGENPVEVESGSATAPEQPKFPSEEKECVECGEVFETSIPDDRELCYSCMRDEVIADDH